VWNTSHANGQRPGSRGVQLRISNFTPTRLREVRLSTPGMERSELKVGEVLNRLRPGTYSRNMPDGEKRRVPNDRMLWRGTALMRFAPFPTINSVLSNAAEHRLQSRHVFGAPMENRTAMTTREGASELPQSNEGCDPPQGGTLRTPPARGPAVAKFRADIHLNFNDAA
jgi:hypothetical protein